MIRMVRSILKFSGSYAGRIRTAYVFSFLKSMFSNAPIFIAVIVLNLLIEGRLDIMGCCGATAALLIFFVLTAVFQNLSDRFQSTAGYEMLAERRMEFAAHLRRLPMGYFTEGNLGRISSVLSSDMIFIEENAMNIVADVASDLFTQAILVIFLFTLHPVLGAAALVTIFAAALVAQPMDRESSADSDRRQESIENLTEAVLEYTEGLAVSKSFRITGESAQKLRGGFGRMTEANLAFERNRTPYERALQLIYGAGMTVILAVAVWLLEKGALPVGSFVGVMLFLFNMFSPIRHMYQMNTRLTIMRTSMRRLQEVMDEKELEDSGAGEILSDPWEHEVEFSHVSFAYDAYDKEEVLHDISFAADRGQMIALVGASGSGKTTIANLLARFWDISDGKILLRGTDIRKIPMKKLMEELSMVFQKVYLFEDTVYNNIAMGRPGATREEVLEAARKAHCYDFIMRLPYGFGTVLSEGGASLSGGERQRISIARCILKDAPIVILDEATASVDADNEAAIHAAMSELCRDKTVLVIAHRLNTIKGADRILVIDKGRIAESGSHAQLLAKPGIYRHMAELQNEMNGEMSA